MTLEQKRQLYALYLKQGMTRWDAARKVQAMDRLPSIIAGLKREGVI